MEGICKRSLRKLKNHYLRKRRAYMTRKLQSHGDGVADPLPHFVVYEPTLLCNLHCGFCYVADILNPEDWRSKELTIEELNLIFGENGVERIVEIKLDRSERAAFKKSVRSVETLIDSIKKLGN